MPNSIRKVVVVSFIGTLVGWYGSFIYGTAAVLVFLAPYFPGSGETTGIRPSYTAFAAPCPLSVFCYAPAEEAFLKNIGAEQRGRA